MNLRQDIVRKAGFFLVFLGIAFIIYSLIFDRRMFVLFIGPILAFIGFLAILWNRHS